MTSIPLSMLVQQQPWLNMLLLLLWFSPEPPNSGDPGTGGQLSAADSAPTTPAPESAVPRWILWLAVPTTAGAAGWIWWRDRQTLVSPASKPRPQLPNALTSTPNPTGLWVTASSFQSPPDLPEPLIPTEATQPLAPGRYRIQLQRSPWFTPSAPLLLWVRGGQFRQPPNSAAAAHAWFTLADDGDDLILDVLKPTALSAIFLDTEEKATLNQTHNTQSPVNGVGVEDVCVWIEPMPHPTVLDS